MEAQAESSTEPRIRLTFDIDPELRRELRMEALQRDIPLREYITQIVEHREAILDELDRK